MSYLIQQNLKLEKFTELDFAVYFELVKNIKVMQMITERALTLEEAHTDSSRFYTRIPMMWHWEIIKFLMLKQMTLSV
jgi:hypothetical protein